MPAAYKKNNSFFAKNKLIFKIWKHTGLCKNIFSLAKRSLFLKYGRDSAKQELCLKNSLLCLATTHKSFEAGAELSDFVFVYLYIVYLYQHFLVIICI